MISPRRKAQFGLLTAAIIFAIAISIVLAGTFENPDKHIGQVGVVAASFRLPDLNDEMFASSSMRGDVVVMCVSPSSDSQTIHQYAHRLADLGRRYQSTRGVKLAMVFSGADELSEDQMRQIHDLAAAAGPVCTVLLDPTRGISRRYGVGAEPVFFVIDTNGTIRYRGGIDDSSPDAPMAATSFNSLIELLLAERPMTSQATSAVLSNIK